MYDFSTAMQIALSPAVTLSVIAVLAIIIVAQAYFGARRMKARLHALSQRLGKMTAMLLAATTEILRKESERQVAHAIEATYDALKDVGFDKLAKGEVTFEGVMFGDVGLKADPLAEFSMDELKEALRPNGIDEGAGLGGKRPYHTAHTDRSPRAG